jgi:Ca2+-binding EF-hand superfamily protein
MKSLFKAFDQKNSGYIDYVEFMKAVIGPLNMVRT